MTATLTEVRTAVAAALATLGVNTYTWHPGSITPPAAVVMPAPGAFLSFQVAVGQPEVQDLDLTVGVYVQWGDEQSAQESLDGYLADTGPSSVYAALRAEPTLGGVVVDVEVLTADDYAVYTWGGVEYLGVQFRLAVML